VGAHGIKKKNIGKKGLGKSETAVGAAGKGGAKTEGVCEERILSRSQPS